MAQAPAALPNTQGPMTTALFGPSGPGAAKTPTPSKPSDAGAPPPPPTPPTTPDTIPDGDTGSPATGAFEDAQESLISSLDKLKKIESEPGPNPPPPISLPPPPQTPVSNPIHSWGSTAMMLALIGSAFTRRPITAALNAGSQVMKANNEKDAAAAQAATEQWKTETENALKLYQYEQDTYAKAIQAHQDNERDAILAVQANAMALKDGPMLAASEVGGLNGVIDMYKKRGKAAANLAGISNTLSKENDRTNNGDAATEAYLNNRYADWIPAYVLSGYDKSLIPEMHSSKDSDDYDVFNKGVQDFETAYNINKFEMLGRRSRVKAINDSLKKIQAQQYQANISSGTFATQWDYIQKNLMPKGAPSSQLGPLVNDYIQHISISGLGDPNTVAYATAIGTMAEEYAKIMSGSTGAAGSTVSAQEFARGLFQTGYNKAQITAAIQTAQANMAAREQQYQQKIDTIQGYLDSANSIDDTSSTQTPSSGAENQGGEGAPPAETPTPAPTPTPTAAPPGSISLSGDDLKKPNGTKATVNGKSYHKEGAYLVPDGT